MTEGERVSDRSGVFDLGELRSWSEAKKCFWLSLIVGTVVAWYVGVGAYLRAHPQAAPYVDRAVLDGWVMPFLLAALASWVLMVLASVWAWRWAPQSKVLSGALGQLYALEIALFGYLLGSHTSPVLAIGFITGVTLGALLWDRGTVLAGVATMVVVTVVTTVGAQMHVLPYGPLLTSSPVRDGRLDPIWLAGFGAGAVFATVLATALVYATMLATRRSEQVLVRSTNRVSRARADLEGAHSRLTELTENLRDTQTQLVQSEKMASLGRLVAGIAHELNNPASFVDGALANLAEFSGVFAEAIHVLQTRAERDPGLRAVLAQASERVDCERLLRETPELLTICSEGSARIRRLVADLRSFTREGHGSFVDTSVRDGIESTLRLLSNRVSEAAVSVNLYGEPAPIPGDPAQLNQLWMNLITNALDALEGQADPAITISFAETEDLLEVRIADNGAGVAPSARERAFEPFFTTKSVGQGTGLGLSISSSIVRHHGGQIALEENPGGGALVRVHLPGGRGSDRRMERG